MDVLNKLKLKGSLNELKGKIKKQFAELTDDDLQFAEGKTEELIGKIKKKTGKSKDEIVRILNNL